MEEMQQGGGCGSHNGKMNVVVGNHCSKIAVSLAGQPLARVCHGPRD